MADLEGDPRPGGLPDVDSQAVINVDFRHPLAVDEHPALRIVVDRDPIAPIEAQQQVRTGDQWVRHAHVGTKITPDNHVAARGEALAATDRTELSAPVDGVDSSVQIMLRAVNSA